MKSLIILLSCLFPIYAFSQSFNSVRTERFYNKVSIKATETPEPDTVIQPPDTVAILQEPPPKLPPKPNFSAVCNPIQTLRVTSPYGMRVHPILGKRAFHSGVDLSARRDTVKSVLNGTVVKSGYDKYLGYFVKVAHGDYVSTYGHLSQYFVLKDETVSSGEGIGITGSTGRATGEHLHFAVNYKDKPINPLQFLHKLNTIYTTLIKRHHEKFEQSSYSEIN